MERAGGLDGVAVDCLPFTGAGMAVERTFVCAYGLMKSGFNSLVNSTARSQLAREEVSLVGERCCASMGTTGVLERSAITEETAVAGRSSMGTATQTLEREATLVKNAYGHWPCRISRNFKRSEIFSDELSTNHYSFRHPHSRHFIHSVRLH